MSLDVTGFITWIRTFLDDIYAEKGSGGDVTVDDALSSTSENPVQNKVVKSAIDGKANSTHSHGSISNDGSMSTTGTTITANNDYILYADRDNSTAKKIRATTRVDNNLIVDTTAHANIGTSANAKQSAINSAINTKLGQVATLDKVYPVGSIYMSVNNTNPSTLFGGTWEQLKDRFLLGAGDSYSNGAAGGEATHTLTQNEMPVHAHKPHQWTIIVSNNANSGNYNNPSGKFFKIFKDDANQNRWTGDSGGGQALNNMPPYLVVYMWKRTA